MRGGRSFRRILWEDQGIADNHTDDSTFLKELRTNVDLKIYYYMEAVQGSAIVLQQIGLVVSFVLVYCYLHEKLISALDVIISFSTGLIASYFMYLALIGVDISCEELKAHVQTFIVFYGFAFGVSPILSSLTATISTDTIYTMVFGFLLANLALADYGSDVVIASQAFSLNTAFAAAVCLASRLPTSLEAFALTICAVGIFGLLPTLLSVIRQKSETGFLIWTLFLLFVNSMFASLLSGFYAGIFVGVIVFIGLCCPALLVYFQRYKTTIHGPWDEAVISVRT